MPKPSIDNDVIDPTTGKAINEKILHDLNPERRGGGNSNSSVVVHNHGQPNRPPHARSDGSTNTSATTFWTSCAKEHRESLQCIERNYQNRSVCEDFFQAYKQCRKDEQKEQGVLNNAANNNNNKNGWWFW
jgi:cytochrome c oxidase assembly protein subunit 23